MRPNPTAMPEPRRSDTVERILAQMTLDEKIGQLQQLSSDSRNLHEKIRAGKVGSVLLGSGATAGNTPQRRAVAGFVNRLQRIAVEESRMGIPIIAGRDVIHGHRTVFPIPMGQAATWDPGSVEKANEITAREAAADGIHWTFAPMVDIGRDPRWGRVAEGYGEDPFLTSRMAEAAVRGFQGPDPSAPDRLAACAKHFAGYGASEGGRDYNAGEVSAYTMRNVYLPPFHAAVRAGVLTLMSAFIDLGGLPVSADPHLMTEILKKEWRFDGFVVTDWGVVEELLEHGIAGNEAEAARLCLNAGIDMEMVSECLASSLPGLIAEGAVDMARVDDAVRRVLSVKERCGLFARPYTDEQVASAVQLRPDHLACARRVAADSLVVLKNEGRVLPLTPLGRIGAFGPLADCPGSLLFGTWTLDGAPEVAPTILSALRERVGTEAEILHAVLSDDAIASARHCDRVVLFLGESPARSGEDRCVSTLELPPGQMEFARALARLKVPLAAVVIGGRPLALAELVELADAVVFGFHPGTQGARAVVDVLFGDAEPNGRLPISFPRSVGHVPIYYNAKRTGRPMDGRTRGQSRYVDDLHAPLFPFGFGLGYTTFSYTGFQIQPLGENRFRAQVVVRNTGDRPGVETVQLYVRDEVARRTRPVKELRGFAKVRIEPGEEAVVSFDLGIEELGYYGPDDAWTVEPGTFTVWIGPNSEDGLSGTLEWV